MATVEAPEVSFQKFVERLVEEHGSQIDDNAALQIIQDHVSENPELLDRAIRAYAVRALLDARHKTRQRVRQPSSGRKGFVPKVYTEAFHNSVT